MTTIAFAITPPTKVTSTWATTLTAGPSSIHDGWHAGQGHTRRWHESLSDLFD